DIVQNLAMGFGIALTPINLLYCFFGVLAGTVIGVLPGIGPATGIAILLPIAFNLNPTSSLITMAGMYYGAMYGGSTTSILMNVPGESATVVTCLDGYQMARQGRAGPALGISAISSFIAGTAGAIGVMLLAPPITTLALGFGPPEYFMLMLFGLTTLAGIAGESMLKALITGGFGLVLGTVGTDTPSGYLRFTFGIPDLATGISFVAVAVGLFALSEVFLNSERLIQREPIRTSLTGLYPTREDLFRCRGAFVRGSLIGFVVGALPGAGATIASFLAYAAEKRASKHPEEFGKGAIEGVAAPEGANNAAAMGALVPMLSLGIPGSGTTAIMLGALIMWGLRPGPLLFEKNPDLVWAVIASMYIGNVMLLILNLPLVGLWASLLRIRYAILAPLILVFCFIGVYSVNNNMFDVWVMVGSGVLGYAMRKFRFPVAPLVLALVLGPMVETALAQSLTMSRGSLAIFFTRPMAVTIFVLMLLFILSPLVRHALARMRGGSPRAAA
ncbi:MAG: tripartite tricarboxylate transporter permease, partial [Candidatus Methylomirabilota bacterium]